MPRPGRSRHPDHSERALARTGRREGGRGDVEEASSAPRIIGGHLGGRRLEFLPDPRTRPMKDRVREALFNLLGFTVEGAIAIDLFAGTGALGFEALSRGATAAWFGERHFPTADCLRRSARALGVEDRTTIRPGDVLLWARRMPEIPRTSPWIAFVSPPWEMFSTHTTELMTLVSVVIAAAPAGSQVVVEAEMSFDPELLPEPGEWTPRPIPPALLLFREIGPPPQPPITDGDDDA